MSLSTKKQHFTVTGMHCANCQQAVEEAVTTLAGVSSAQVDLDKGLLTVKGGNPADIIKAIEDAGYKASLNEIENKTNSLTAEEKALKMPLASSFQSAPPSDSTKAITSFFIDVPDIHCASCVSRVEEAAKKAPGVQEVTVNLLEKRAQVHGGNPDEVSRAIEAAGYAAKPVAKKQEGQDAPFTLLIEGMTCAACVRRVEEAIIEVPGVTEAAVHLLNKSAQVTGGSPEEVIRAIIAQGYEARLSKEPARAESFFLLFSPLPRNQGERKQLEEIILAHDANAKLSWDGEKPRVSTLSHPADLVLWFCDIDYKVELQEVYQDPADLQEQESRREVRRSWWRALVAGLTGFVIMAGHMSGLFPAVEGHRNFWLLIAVFCLGVMWYSGRNYYITAWKQAKHFAANMDTLVALGTAAAWLSSLLVLLKPSLVPGMDNHLYLDASVMILAFLQFGHALEIKAKRTTSRAISSLVGLRASDALVRRPGGKARVPVSLLWLDDQIMIKPGEKIPIDGTIIEGQSNIDESMLTGEPVAVLRGVGDPVIGGTINRSGALTITVTHLGEDTTLAKIIRMVRHAQMSKPSIGRLVDKVAGVFVPIVIGISGLTFLIWALFGPEPRLASALTTAIAVLVIACPCALGLATPIAIMVGTSRAAQQGILIKNSEALQSASTLTHIIVDKTGTLTLGKPAVTALFPAKDVDEEQLLQLAASLENKSEHPLAEAIVAAQTQKGGTLLDMENFAITPGRGIRGDFSGQGYILGNDHFLKEQGFALPRELHEKAIQQARESGTPVWLASEKKVLGLLILKDPLRSDTLAAVRSLQEQGKIVVMCTGDNAATAAAVAGKVGIEEVHSEVLPEDKLSLVQQLQAQGFKVGMVGDGVNDAPALAQADTGFAIGGGTDVAIENSDITLTGDSLFLVADAIAISHATIKNIKQNLVGAFLYNTLGIPLAAGLFYPFTGWLLHPMFASAAMALSSVTVVTNANRLRFFRFKRDASSERRKP